MQTFRCFIRENRIEKTFDAVCIDLNLVDRRESPDEAIAAMIENIERYLETAYEHNEADKLIPRPAPLADQLYYRWLLIKSFFCAISQGIINSSFFSAREKGENTLCQAAAIPRSRLMISQSGLTREEFYSASKKTAKKIH